MKPPHSASRNGLICGYRFEAGARGQELGLDETLEWLAEPGPRAPGEFV